MDYELKRYLSNFTALAAELRKKMRTAAKPSCNKKNQVAIKKANKKTKKRDGSVSKLKVIPLSSISPLFSKGFFTSIFNKYTASNDISNVCKSGGKHRKLHLIYDSLWKLLST